MPVKPYLVTYKDVDAHGNLGSEHTTTVHANNQREASQTLQRKANYKIVVTRVRKGGY
jgi:hypothetical protein